MAGSTNLILRLLWIPVSVLFLSLLVSNVFRDINNIIYALTEASDPIYLKWDERESLVIGTVTAIVLAYISLEILGHLQDRTNLRVLTHLRYGAIAVLLIANIAVIAFDAAMVQISHAKVRAYIYNGSPDVRPADLGYLHNPDRGWCGNGASATYESIYYPTAAGGLGDADPAVRARAFLAATEIRDFLNGSPRFRADVETLCRDESAVVHQVVDGYLSRSNSSCIKVLDPDVRTSVR